MDDRKTPALDLGEDIAKARDWLAGRGVRDSVSLRRCMAAFIAVQNVARRDVFFEYGVSGEYSVEALKDPFVSAVALEAVTDERMRRASYIVNAAEAFRTTIKNNLEIADSKNWDVKDWLELAIETVAMAFYRQRPDVMQEAASDKIVMSQAASDRLVFIDIDGVLLSFRSWTTAHNAPLWRLPVEQRMKHLELDQTSIGLLVRLCDHARAKLVLTSTWRKTWPDDLPALHNRLIEQGLRRDLWHQEWRLPFVPDGTKWQELAKWGGWSPNAGALIIDDELPPEDAPPALAEQAILLQADKYEGFGAYNYFDALGVFGVEDKDVKPPKGLPPDRGVRLYPTVKAARRVPAPSMYRP